jgi:hypothetical protein
MKRFVFSLLLFSWTGLVYGQRTYYVAPDGNDTTGDGSITAPWATLAPALSRAVAGDTIYLRGGQYNWTTRVNLNRSGTSQAYLHLWAYPGETPVLNFEGNPQEGIRLRGWYVHLKGIVVQRAGDNGIRINGSHNIIEQVVVRENGDSGLQLDSGAAYNLILNVDSYRNYDVANHGENADGFAAKFNIGPGNVFRGCRAFDNSDDGFDFWDAGAGVSVEDSWSFDNGYNRWNDPSFEGDSNGFKLGRDTTRNGNHVLIRNLAWGHRANGFDVNGNRSGVVLYNNTAYRNGGQNFRFDEMNSAHVLRNNLSVEGRVLMYPLIDHAYNSWNLGLMPTTADFLSLDTTGVRGPRQPDGSLPQLDFLRLAAGSPLIDAGIDVGLPYIGQAPDLGAYEFGLTTGVGTHRPVAFRLLMPYPNPFWQAVRVRFELLSASKVSLSVWDLMGRRVALLLEESRDAGVHEVYWETPAGLAAGLYLLVLEADGYQARQPLVYMH